MRDQSVKTCFGFNPSPGICSKSPENTDHGPAVTLFGVRRLNFFGLSLFQFVAVLDRLRGRLIKMRWWKKRRSRRGITVRGRSTITSYFR